MFPTYLGRRRFGFANTAGCVSLGLAFGFVASMPRSAEAIEPSRARKVDWTTMASTYTHDVQGQRVDQHSRGIEPVTIARPDYQRSGYRQYRSSLQAGSSADHIHIVDQWGDNVRPYGEWRYPYRPFSVPYGAWGPPPPLVQGGVVGGIPRPWPAVGPGFNAGMPGGPGFGLGFGQAQWPIGGYAPGWNTGFPGPGAGPANALPAYQDEYYPPAPDLGPTLRDREFFFQPSR